MKKEIEIKKKKPRLAYDGMDKKTLVEAVPTQVVEVVYPKKAGTPEKDEQQNKLFEEGQLGTGKVKKADNLPKNRLIWTNDNLVALKTLLDEKDPVSGEYKYRNKVDLIYIDPPFMVQDDFVAQNTIDIDINKEEGVVSVKEPTIIETIAYKDTWQNGLDSFLQMMRERLELMKELLSPSGSIYVHLDWHTSHYVKVLMDEIFDYPLFINEVIWKSSSVKNDPDKRSLPVQHHSLLLYSKSTDYYFDPPYAAFDEDYIKKNYKLDDNDGRGSYTTGPLYSSTVSGGYAKAKSFVFRGLHKRWIYSLDTLKKWDNEGRLYKTGKGGLRKKIYLSESKGRPATDLWIEKEVQFLTGSAEEYADYPTQKPLSLLKRIILSSCPKDGIVLDAFAGSGTTCVAAEQLADRSDYSWIGIDNSKFAIHTTRKRLIELNGKPKEKKGEGVYKVRPFTVENMGYYQRGVKWDAIQTSKQADTYRQAIIELFGGEYSPYSQLLHGKKRGTWIHVGPLSQPLVSEQVLAIAKEVKDTEFNKCYVLSADFTAHLNKAVEEAKEKFGVQITTRIIPASAIEEVKKRLELIKQGVKDPKKVSDMPNLAFFAPLTVKINKVVDGKEAMIELAGVEVDAESFLESQKPDRRDELKKWLEKEKSWQSFVDFWAIDWDYENLKSELKEEIFENEWQSFRKRKGKKVVEDLVFKAFHTYEKPGEYTVAVKVTDVFGNDGIVTAKIVIKK